MPEEQTSQSQQTPQTVAPSRGNTMSVPIAIIVAALLIGGAIIYTGTHKQGGPVAQIGGTVKTQETKDIVVAPVTEKDHIRGNPNAPIMIVEYSDFDCPFCKQFHETMKQIISDYGNDGKVAWVYRQLPIKQLHPNAEKIAAASECVANLGGNDAFWKFADQVVENREINAQTDITKLPTYAEAAGVNKAKFTDCYSKGTYDSFIQESIQAATAAGAQGTPYSLLIVGDQQGVINGAQPYATVKQMIETMLTQLER